MIPRLRVRVRVTSLRSASASSPLRALWATPLTSSFLCSSSPFFRSPCRHKSCGIVGLANVGKSTLFNALTSTQLAEAANYPFTTVEPTTAFVAIRDPLLTRLASVARSSRTLYTQLHLVDIAGLIKGASQGAGLGAKFLNNIREVDVLLHVVRCFHNDDIVHIHSKVDPLDDAAVVEEELMLADLATVEKRLETAGKKGKATDSPLRSQVLQRCAEALNAGIPILDVQWKEEEQPHVNELRLLTHKPLAIICNVDEASGAQGNELSARVHAAIASRNASPHYTTPSGLHVRPHPRTSLHLSAQLEADAVAGFDSEEARREFLALSSLTETALEQCIRTIAVLLKQSFYYTVGPEESKAWTIPTHCTALEAAGKIHSDIAAGFIAVEVIKPTDYLELGSEEAVKAAGKMRLEGKEYRVQEGDILHFRFNKTTSKVK